MTLNSSLSETAGSRWLDHLVGPFAWIRLPVAITKKVPDKVARALAEGRLAGALSSVTCLGGCDKAQDLFA